MATSRTLSERKNATWNTSCALYFDADNGVVGRELWKADGILPLAGDFDRNGPTDFSDFLILSSNFDKDGTNYLDGDIDGDRKVGFDDFVRFADGFGERGNKPVEAVPRADMVDHVFA